MNYEAIAEQARTWIGTKFHHQGRKKKLGSFQGGVDCIGLVVGVVKELDLKSHISENEVAVPLHKFDKTGYGREPNGQLLKTYFDDLFEPSEEMEPGNILLFRFAKFPQHTGIVGRHPSGELSLIHAYMPSGQVVEHILNDKWKANIVGVYKFKQTAFE